tara:strand:+ start:2592 stop:3392 length:801 start_codon:yes stop_codon:yes gene_type:complete
MINHKINKKGTVVLLIISLAYLITTVSLLYYGTNPQKDFVGAKALRSLDELNVGKEVQLYLDQSVRNSMYLAAKDLKIAGPFADSCKKEDLKVLLFSKDSCILEEKKLQEKYLTFFKKHFITFLKEPFKEVTFVDGIKNYDYTITVSENSVEIIGLAKKQLSFKGEDIAYTLNPSFRESIPYNLKEYLFIYEKLSLNTNCLLKQDKEIPGLDCGIRPSFTLFKEQKGDIAYLKVIKTKPKHVQTNIAISFAINLKTLQETQNNLFT